jgi:hypothetical protein
MRITNGQKAYRGQLKLKGKAAPKRKQSSEGELIAVREERDQLLVDLDSRAALQEFEKRIHCLVAISCKSGPCIPIIKEWRVTKSRNGNYHAYVTLIKPMPLQQRNTLRIILGDDPYRAIHNFMRTLHGSPAPVVFFEKELAQ